MAQARRPLPLLFLAGLLCAGSARAASLEPGIAIVESRDRQQLRLRLDRDSTVYPAQLQGLTVVVRRLVEKVYAPQAWRPFAEEWREVGTAVILPIHKTGGDFIGQLVWEDVKSPVKPGDRVESCRVPPDALQPLIVSIRCRSVGGDAPAVAPAQVVWLEAEVVSLDGGAAPCAWSCDAGAFLHPGGLPSGREFAGPSAVQWQAPPEPAEQVTVRLRVAAGPRGKAAEQTLSVRVVAPAGPYAEARQLRTRLPLDARGKLGPLFAEVSRVAAGPPGAFYLVDGPGKRLLHWAGGDPRYLALDGQAAALAACGGTACLVRGSAVLRLDGGKLTEVAALPDVKRLVGVHSNGVGDLFVLDSGAPPSLHVLAAGTKSWQAAPLEPRVDSPWLHSFAVDPHSNDVFMVDTRDRMVRHWRALEGSRYRLVAVPIAIGKAIDKLGPPVAILPRTDCDPLRDLPIQLVFGNGAVTDKWTAEGEPARWEPVAAPLPRALLDLRLAVTQAARLPDGDLLVGGTSAAPDAKGPALVQLSPRGEFRRMLPLPEAPPRLVAVAPDGRRYVVLARPSRRGVERLIVLDQDGWMAQDFGPLDGYRTVVGLRPDRGSSGHVLLIADRQRRVSVFRIDAAQPALTLELSAAGIPGGRIPDHEARDAASSPDRIVVLDRKGKVLVFTNTKPIRFAGDFDSGVKEPKAVALLAGVGQDQAQSYVCVLDGGGRAPAIHVWELRLADAGKLLHDRIGTFPDPERSEQAARLSSPVTLDSAFPDSRGTLFALDAAGSVLRAFDAAAIAGRLQRKLPPELPTAPAIPKLSLKGEGLDLSIGPGQAVHIAEEEGEAIHTYTRRP